MGYHVITTSQAVRDLEEALFYKAHLGTHQENIDQFKAEVLTDIRRLQISPKIGSNLSSRIYVETNIKYHVIQDYILLYEIEGQLVKVLRLLSAKSDWIHTILK